MIDPAAPRARLILEDGAIFEGLSLGATRDAVGEVVFNTSMTGYQEMLTDPSYKGQLLVLTYPLIGNYGFNRRDFEASRAQPAGLIVRQPCFEPSHNASEQDLGSYLRAENLSAIYDLDTRALTLKIRSKGAMMGMITTRTDLDAALQDLRAAPRYGGQRFVEPQRMDKYNAPPVAADAKSPLKVALIDYGVKFNIVRLLNARGCDVRLAPYDADFGARVADLDVDGVVFSPGPGDPQLESAPGEGLRAALWRGVPVFGICLGHQLLAREFGAQTYKLKFGHRGGNQPVQDLASGKIKITAHNHGYAVSADDFPPELKITHINLNDNTVEGLAHKSLPLLTIQYHAEAAPGPTDAEYLFDQFVKMVAAYRLSKLSKESR